MRALALSLAVVALVVFVGGCGTDNRGPDLAGQDKAVQLGNQLAALHQRVVQARRLVARQQRNAARPSRSGTTSRRSVPVARTSGFSLTSLCSPAKPAGKRDAARRLRKQRERVRRQALYMLNLSCPPTRS